MYCNFRETNEQQLHAMFTLSLFMLIQNFLELPCFLLGMIKGLFRTLSNMTRTKRGGNEQINYYFLVMKKKQLDWKNQVNFKIYDATSWLTNSCNTHIAQNLIKERQPSDEIWSANKI